MNNKENIESELKPYLLQHVAFMLNNKIIKRGRLQLVNTKQFFIKFNLETNDGVKVFEIPYPYKCSKQNNMFTFEYTLSSLCNSNKTPLYHKLKSNSHKGVNKMHDNYLHLLIL